MHVPRPLYAEIKQFYRKDWSIFTRHIHIHLENFTAISCYYQVNKINRSSNIVSGALDSETTVYQMKPCLYFLCVTYFFPNSSFQKDFEKANI